MVVFGETLDEARANAREELETWLGAREANEPPSSCRGAEGPWEGGPLFFRTPLPTGHLRGESVPSAAG